jgi:hypothetical protein
MTEWQRMFDELADEDLVLVGEDAALSSSIRRKRPDARAVHWGRRATFIQESTRPNDGADDWQTRTDACKAERYRPLRDKLKLPEQLVCIPLAGIRRMARKRPDARAVHGKRERTTQRATHGWSFHRESTVGGADGLRGIQVPL